MTKAGFYVYTIIRCDSPFYGNSSYSLACEPMVSSRIVLNLIIISRAADKLALTDGAK
jgi:hypothetical protein